MARRQMTVSEFQEWIEAFRRASPELQREAIRILRENQKKPEADDVGASQAARGGDDNG